MKQKFDNKALDLVKQKRFDPYEYVNDFEKFKEELPSKETFYSLLTGRKIVIRNRNMLLMFRIHLK